MQKGQLSPQRSTGYAAHVHIIVPFRDEPQFRPLDLQCSWGTMVRAAWGNGPTGVVNHSSGQTAEIAIVVM